MLIHGFMCYRLFMHASLLPDTLRSFPSLSHAPHELSQAHQQCHVLLATEYATGDMKLTPCGAEEEKRLRNYKHLHSNLKTGTWEQKII
jgi:hypothetical protein